MKLFLYTHIQKYIQPNLTITSICHSDGEVFTPRITNFHTYITISQRYHWYSVDTRRSYPSPPAGTTSNCREVPINTTEREANHSGVPGNVRHVGVRLFFTSRVRVAVTIQIDHVVRCRS